MLRFLNIKWIGPNATPGKIIYFVDEQKTNTHIIYYFLKMKSFSLYNRENNFTVF